MFDIDEMVDEFLQEAREHRDNIEELLLAIEACDPQQIPKLINELFRSVHSIKGSAGTVEFENVCALTHAMETELSKVREGELEVSAQLISALLGALDVLNDMLKNVERQELVDASQAIASLAACSDHAGNEPLATPEPESSAQSPNGPLEPTIPEPVIDLDLPDASVAEGPVRSTKSLGETIRVPVWTLDSLMALAGELVLVRNRQLQRIDERLRKNRRSVSHTDRRLCQQLDLVTSEIQDAVLRTRMQPVGIAFQKLRRLCRDLGNKLGKQIQYESHGSETEIDKTILECLGDPLMHLVRNACDHGLGTPEQRRASGKPALGNIKVSAHQDGGQIVIQVQDDGQGINVDRVRNKAMENGLCRFDELEGMTEKQICMLIFSPGFSTASHVSDISGRGVGMDVVKTSIEKIGGSVDVESVSGQGTTFVMRVPLTLAIVSSLIVRSGQQCYAIPQVNLEEVVCLHDQEVADKLEFANNHPSFRLRGQLIPLVYLQDVLATDPHEVFSAQGRSNDAGASMPSKLTFAVVRLGTQNFGIVVDAAVGTEEIVVKPNHPILRDVRCFVGSTVLGDGGIALILDVNGIAQHAGLDGRFCEPSQKLRQVERPREVLQQLAFTLTGEDRYLFPLSLVSRVVSVRHENLDYAAGVCSVNVDGKNLRVVDVAKYLDVETDYRGQELALILPYHINRPVGFLCKKVLDLRLLEEMPNSETHRSDCVLGSLVLDDRLALVLDMFGMVHAEEPSWFTPTVAPAEETESPKRILLAEDTAFFRRVVGRYLRELGYEVVVAEDGELAAQVLASKDHGFDMLISDIQMPNLDGFGLITRLRREAAWSHCKGLPAMAMSSLSAPEVQLKAIELGFDRYELKLDQDSLKQSVATLLGLPCDIQEVA